MVERFDAQAMTYTGAATPVITEELHLRSAGNRARVSYVIVNWSPRLP